MSPEELDKLKKRLKDLPKSIVIPKIDENLKIAEAKGCSVCNNTGYKGRIAIFEAFLVGPELENFILSSPSVSALKKKAVEQGMITMHQDGLIKVLEGLSTIEEIERVASP